MKRKEKDLFNNMPENTERKETKNTIFIGDNYPIMSSGKLDYLKNKIDFIYIDPPYNTNSSLSYNDKNDLWSEDISKRLLAALPLMTESGVIFISIDDNELANLLRICYEVFGVENYVGIFITKQSLRSNAKHINIIHEYVICFAKNRKKLQKFYIRRMDDPKINDDLRAIINKTKNNVRIGYDYASKELKGMIDNFIKKTGQTWIKNYSTIDEDGNIFFGKDLSTPGTPTQLDIDEINLHLKPLKTRGWSSPEKFISLYNANRLTYKAGRPYAIEYLEEATDNVTSILDFYSRQGTNELKKLGFDGLFDTPKPVELIKFLIRCSLHKDSIIMDFYAGSGTTAQAVYEINEEDGMKHNYVLIQLDEMMNKKTEPYKIMTQLGYNVPKVSDAMLLRIKTFLRKNNLPEDYDVIYHVYD